MKNSLATCIFSISWLLTAFTLLKAELLARYGGVAPKMAEEAHSQVIDEVWF